MKVKELIEALQKLPPEKDVYAEGSGGNYSVQVWEYRNEKYPDDETFVVICPSDVKET